MEEVKENIEAEVNIEVAEANIEVVEESIEVVVVKEEEEAEARHIKAKNSEEEVEEE